MDPSLNKEIIKDIFGLGAVFVYLCTMLLAAFKWNDDPGPIGAVASVPLVLFVAAYIYKKYFAGRTGRGAA